MDGLFFEVRPHPGHLAHYFAHVDRLRPVLARHEGLLFLDRFRSLDHEDVLLSHQLWRDEEAIVEWRRDPEHRRSQNAGNRVHFADYRIRVGALVLDWQAGDPPPSSGKVASAHARYVLAVYGSSSLREEGFAAFESVNHEGRFIALAEPRGRAEAVAAHAALIGREGVSRSALFAVRRDYGLFERDEAPSGPLPPLRAPG